MTIVIILEAFVGVRYLIDLVAYPSFDFAWMLLLALMLISFLVAYGLWHFARWAWVISFVLSLFGVISTTYLLAIGGASGGMLFQSIPYIIIDVIVIIILLTRGVRDLFWGTRAGKALVAPSVAPQNP